MVAGKEKVNQIDRRSLLDPAAPDSGSVTGRRKANGVNRRSWLDPATRDAGITGSSQLGRSVCEGTAAKQQLPRRRRQLLSGFALRLAASSSTSSRISPWEASSPSCIVKDGTRSRVRSQWPQTSSDRGEPLLIYGHNIFWNRPK